MIITHEGLSALANINSSCRVFGEKKIRNLKYLIKCAASWKNLRFSEFAENLPQKSFMYEGIRAFALAQKEKSIDNKLVCEFFGGAAHIAYTLEQEHALDLREKRGDEFADALFFAHILTPVTLTFKGNNVSALYSNRSIYTGHMEVRLKNLVVHPHVKIGRNPRGKALVHYATVVAYDVPEKMVEWLLREQGQSLEFSEVAKRVDEIDYAAFWNLKDWTEELFKKCYN